MELVRRSEKSSAGNSLPRALRRLKSNFLTLLVILFEPNPDNSRVCWGEHRIAKKKAKVRKLVRN